MDLVDITWVCHVCGRERSDEFISVYSETFFFGRVPIQFNVRHCSDREWCGRTAPKISEDWAIKIRGASKQPTADA